MVNEGITVARCLRKHSYHILQLLTCNFMDEISLNNCWQQCCKSYSIQEVLEAAQASQHFRNFFLFSSFIWGIVFCFVLFFDKVV